MQASISFALNKNSFPCDFSLKNLYKDVFGYKIQVTKEINLNPFEAIGVARFSFLVIFHAKKFIDTFRAKEIKLVSSLVLVERDWDKARNRVVSALNVVGAISGFLEWGSCKEWFVLRGVNAVGLRILVGFVGIVHYADRSIRSLQKVKELERLAEIAKVYQVCKKEVFDAAWYRHYSGFVANFLFMSYSGLQFVNGALGILVASKITAMLLAGGVGMFFVSYFFYLTDDSTIELDRVRLLDPRFGASDLPSYSFIAR
jgi:hypothetical protein